jgi:hypothetical protein
MNATALETYLHAAYAAAWFLIALAVLFGGQS